MSSQGGPREDGRRLSPRTLGIASVASASAAVVTSLFWKGGTPIAAAVTPVIVSLVSEMLHRPAEKIASRFTTETDALPAEAAGGGAPPPRDSRGAHEPPAREIASAHRQRTAVREERPRTLPATAGEPARPASEPEMKVYRAPSRRPRLAFKPIAATAAIAFVIAAAVLTLPELIAGQSFGQGDRGTTLFGGSGKKDSSSSDQESRDSQQDTQSQPEQSSPDQPPDSQGTQEQTTPPEPPAEEPPPESRQAPPTTSPAPAAPGEPAP